MSTQIKTMAEFEAEKPQDFRNPTEEKTMNKTYWTGQGRYQLKADALEKLLPIFGEVEDGKGANKHLETFRRAVNCYYDVYNNGLCNRAREFSTLFKIAGVAKEINSRRANGMLSMDTQERIEDKMSLFILAAFQEQFVEETTE
jgi:hypothetical protein